MLKIGDKKFCVESCHAAFAAAAKVRVCFFVCDLYVCHSVGYALNRLLKLKKRSARNRKPQARKRMLLILRASMQVQVVSIVFWVDGAYLRRSVSDSSG